MSSFSEKIDTDLDASSGSSSSDPSEAVDRLQEIKKYFTNEGLQFRTVIAQGNHGGAVPFDQWLPVEPDPAAAPGAANNDAPEAILQRRQLVMKYALDTREDAASENDEDLRNEFRWLRLLRGAEHIIQILPEYNYLWRSGRNRNRSDNNAGGEGEGRPIPPRHRHGVLGERDAGPADKPVRKDQTSYSPASNLDLCPMS